MVWIILVRQNEINAFLWLPFVANENVVMFTAFRRAFQRNDEFFIGGGKFRVLAVHCYVVNGQVHGIKLNRFNAVAHHGNAFVHFAAYFFLFEVEPQMGFDVLQIVVLAAGIRLIRARDDR